MRQVWITKPGDPEVLQVREAEDPEPGPGDIVVDVAAAGVNFADLMARMGTYPDAPPIPCVVGYEVAGTVRAVGEGVASPKKGERVLALTRFGGYSTVVTVPADQAFSIPESMTFEEAAALPVNYLTAYLALFTMGNLQREQRCLIQGAGGGVGIAAVQLASSTGAEVFGTASAGKHEFLSTIGVDHLIDYTRSDFAAEVQRITDGRGVHLILDSVGGKSVREGYKILASLGRIVCFGISSSVKGGKRSYISLLRAVLAMPLVHPVPLMNANRGILGLNLGHLWKEIESLRAAMTDILVRYREGQVKPVIAKVFPFTDASAAHRFIHERRNIGKVLLTPEF
jgi:NADPH:quinone reductase-like Zn-dependent oxidoreductase